MSMARKSEVAALRPTGRSAARAAPPPPAKTVKAKSVAKTPTKAVAKTVAPAVRGRTKVSLDKSKTVAPPVKQPAVSLKQIAAGLSESRGMTARDAQTFAAELIGSVVEHVKTGAKVKIAGLGVVEIKDRPARMARNPATGEPVSVEASRKIVFRVAKDLRDAI